MQAIFDVIKGIGQFISSLVTIVVKVLEDLVYVVQILLASIPKIPTYLSFLPSAVLSLFVGALSIVVVYKIVGRD